MTIIEERPATTGAGLRTRLAPLHAAVFLHGVMLWVSVEKLFMTEIGFTPASVGLMAAAYSVFVPLIEVLTGVLADRWSRRGVLMLASVALAGCSLLGAVSHDVFTYILSALALGFYFAMYSGTMDAVVYDTVLEEAGDSEPFERAIGKVRMTEAVALVLSSLAGGWIAELTSTRTTYWLSVPFALASVVAWLRFREPTLHQGGEEMTLRQQLATTYRTVVGNGRLLQIATLAVLTAVTMQLLFEFGPLWLVALAVPAVLYGPYWAALVSSLGLGGLLAGRLHLDDPRRLTSVAAAMVALSVLPNLTSSVLLVMAAQVGLALLMVAATIHVSRLLHDAIPSNVRTGVASGVGAVTWLAFLPVALVFGFASEGYGVHRAGWLITLATVAVAGLLIRLANRAVAR